MLAGWDTEQYSLENKVRTAISVLEEQKFVERDFNHARVYAVSLLVRDVGNKQHHDRRFPPVR